MGWIANLKKTPAFGAVEDISVTGGQTKTVVNGDASLIKVTQGAGANKVQFGPLPKGAAGAVKIAVCVAYTSETVTVGPYPAGADGSSLKNVVFNAVGESCQWVWDGAKWNTIDALGVGGAAAGSDF
tara:strand:+ start:4473 stop:4853 length:381 start_codon:yes stop_codon:yes gene_type:complete